MGDCNACLVGDYIDSEFFRRKDVRGRKEYRCYECNQIIPAGTLHQYATGKCEGHFWDARTCLTCAEIRQTFYCDGPEMYGEFWSQMRDYVFPELTTGCLDRLKTPQAKKELLRRWSEWKFDRVKLTAERR